MELNENALISLEDAKGFLGITGTSKDIILTVYINGISDYILGEGKTILKTDYIEKYQGTGTQNLILNNKPVNSISSLKNNGEDVTNYEILKNEGVVYRDYGWVLSGSTRPMMHDRINQVYKTIEVEYNAGFDKVPSDLTMLVLELLDMKYNIHSSKGLASYKISDVAKTWKGVTEMLSPDYKTILFKYKGLNI